jgi:uncharacterized linocin/CFP29 family protein
MNHLLRSHAPITDAGWDLVDSEARRQLVAALAGRKLVDFSGPHGWQHSAVNLGRTVPLGPAAASGVRGQLRKVLPLTELRTEFSVARAELLDADRGAEDVDLDDLMSAARRVAVAENVAVFHGWEEAGIVGITAASTHDSIALGTDFADYPSRPDTPESSRRLSTVDWSCSTTCARFSADRSSGHPESKEPWS